MMDYILFLEYSVWFHFSSMLSSTGILSKVIFFVQSLFYFFIFHWPVRKSLEARQLILYGLLKQRHWLGLSRAFDNKAYSLIQSQKAVWKDSWNNGRKKTLITLISSIRPRSSEKKFYSSIFFPPFTPINNLHWLYSYCSWCLSLRNTSPSVD